MKITRTIQVDSEITVDVRCNKCGDSLIPPSERSVERAGNPPLYGLVEQTVSGGFESTALHDLEHYTFSICEPCLKEMFDGFRTRSR